MTTLIEFLEARLTEDMEIASRAAKSANGNHRQWYVTNVERRSETTGLPRKQKAVVQGPRRDLVADCPHDITPEKSTHIARHDPARVLREVQAKRAILAAYRPPNEQAHPGPCTESIEHDPEGKDWDDDSSHGPCERHVEAMHARRGQPHASEHILKYLATTWSDHPDYRKEWAA